MENDVGLVHYKYFKSVVPEQIVFSGPHGDKWRYYDFGPKNVNPIVCMGGISSTADVFYMQILHVSRLGYRVVAVDPPPFSSFRRWCSAFDHFLDVIDVDQVHIYGTSLGGFLSQLFCSYKPRRVLSLLLSNSFLDTSYFHSRFGKWRFIFHSLPDFILRQKVISLLPEGPSRDCQIADSVDFVVSCMKHLSQRQLASRLYSCTDLETIGPLRLPDDKITIMDCLDYVSEPEFVRDALYIRYPKAYRAYLKTGADFPFLSRPAEVALHLVLHLRHVGAEITPDDFPRRIESPRSSDITIFKNSTLSSPTSSVENRETKSVKLIGESLGDPLNSCAAKLVDEGAEDNDDLDEIQSDTNSHARAKSVFCLVKGRRNKKFIEILVEESDEEDNVAKEQTKDVFRQSGDVESNQANLLVSVWKNLYFFFLHNNRAVEQGQPLSELKKTGKDYDSFVDSRGLDTDFDGGYGL